MRLVGHLIHLLVRAGTLSLGLVAAVAGLGAVGGAFSDRPDILAHFAPIWLAAGLLAVVGGWVFSKDEERRAIIGLGLVGAAASGVLIAPEILRTVTQRRVEPQNDTITIVQANLWKLNRDPEATAQWILAQNADYVVVEEAGALARPVVKALQARYPHMTACNGRLYCATRIFSREPAVAASGWGLAARTGLPGVWARFERASGPITVVGVHYFWPIPAGPQQAQSRRLIQALEGFDAEGLVVAGDFNSTPWSYTLRRQDAALKRAHGLTRRTRALASWPAGAFNRVLYAPIPVLPLDHVYAGKVWRTVRVERGPMLGSDHYPIVATLTR